MKASASAYDSSPETGVRLSRAFGVTFLLGTYIVSVGCTSNPSLPPLLRGVSSGGGGEFVSPCPDEEIHISSSAQLLTRLNDAVGTLPQERDLVTLLLGQGFSLGPSCKSDPSVRAAGFGQICKGVLCYDTIASVQWKVDETNRVVWMNGYVFHMGL
jgi:hypothetical protein